MVASAIPIAITVIAPTATIIRPIVASMVIASTAAVTAIPAATVTTVMTVPSTILIDPVVCSWRRLVIARCRLINPRLVVITRRWLVIPCRR
ncbi:hypothetical protein BK663_21365 [Pseudomonas lini]|uniref:Uncharacterized protein n=1 Tax=Pseudomonas lini TaxID=163011 RepID=A0A423IF25_9PSED|nr:hypothetical protein BK663_21365 [Pseudomonas lini]